MNRITQAFEQDKKLLSIYFTAGYPKIEDTTTILKALELNGVDFVEIGMPQGGEELLIINHHCCIRGGRCHCH